jgi:hypothetical protein
VRANPGGTLTQPRRKGSIEIDEDIDFQKRSWSVQRAGWVVMLLIVAAALLGLFGGGPVSNAHAGDANLLSIDYERFVRLESPEKITLNIGGAAARGGSSIDLWIDRGWLAKHDVNSIVPEPSETRVTPDKVIYRFDVDSTGVPTRIEFDLETKAMGVLKGRAGIAGGNPVTFNQLAYP